MADEADNTIRVHVFISGRVQGVSFRWFTQRQATKLGLTGWVRNLWDGRVEAVFEGEAEAVKQVVQWCHQGEPPAQVTDVSVKQETPTYRDKTFKVRY